MSNAKTFQDWAKEILPIVEAAANGAAIEFKQDGVWYEKAHNDLCYDYEYRIRPNTIRIGEYDVPEPLREMPTASTVYYVPTLANIPVCSYMWKCSVSDIDRLNMGLIHLCADSAALHAKALLSITEVRL